MLTFIAGANITGHFAASRVVLSMSSAIPCAALAIILAEAGATKIMSARCATAICLTSLTSARSKVSVRQRFFVRVSNAVAVIKFSAFFVMMTSTFALSFTSALARFGIL